MEISVIANKASAVCRGGMNFTLVFKYINGAINRLSPVPPFPFGREAAQTGLNYRFNRITSTLSWQNRLPEEKEPVFFPARMKKKRKRMLPETLLANKTEPKSFFKSSLAPKVVTRDKDAIPRSILGWS